MRGFFKVRAPLQKKNVLQDVTMKGQEKNTTRPWYSHHLVKNNQSAPVVPNEQLSNILKIILSCLVLPILLLKSQCLEGKLNGPGY